MSEKSDNIALASAFAGILGSSSGKLFSHPVDTLKAKLQVMAGASFSKEKKSRSVLLDLARETVRAEGVPGLYRGLPITIVGGAPAAFLYFGSYEFFKKHTL